MTAQPKPHDVRVAIADSIAEHATSYDAATWCESLGLAPAGGGEDPHRSKRVYVQGKLTGMTLADLLSVAKGLLAEWTTRCCTRWSTHPTRGGWRVR